MSIMSSLRETMDGMLERDLDATGMTIYVGRNAFAELMEEVSERAVYPMAPGDSGFIPNMRLNGMPVVYDPNIPADGFCISKPLTDRV